MSAEPLAERQAENPYRGPRPLPIGDDLFGRDNEATGLTHLLIAERIVLLHAPSGAGKTSLIQAGVIPRLVAEQFHISGPLRLNLVSEAPNRYVFSAVNQLLADAGAGSDGDGMTLAEGLAMVEEHLEGTDHVLIFDQFEEVLTLDPNDREVKIEFFSQLGAALEPPHRFALISMREDFMGGLARFVGLVPTRLDVRFRLDFLEREAAAEAMRGPAERQGVTFTPEAAQLLAQDLSAIRVQHREQTPDLYVDAVHLQVVCETLWRQLEQKNGGRLERIDADDITAFGELDKVLGMFYADAVADVATEMEVSQGPIRTWFERELITPARYRSQASRGPEVGERVADVLRLLEDRYLVRSDTRHGTRWYELSHERLIAPVLESNADWKLLHASTWELDANRWQRLGRPDSLLLEGHTLRQATKWLAESRDADDVVKAFVHRSQAVVNESVRRRMATMEAKVWVLSFIVALLLVVVAVQFALLVAG